MSVVIRLAKVGRKGEAKFHVVVTEKRTRRDGNIIESLGFYEKTEKGQQKKVNDKRYDYWLSKGALPSPTVEKIMQQR